MMYVDIVPSPSTKVELGDLQGFWQAFADGVDNINVSDGMLNIELKE